jgi:DNA-binding response OmpR family regulator
MDTRSVLSVAVLEDEALIALDIEETLRDAGFNVAAVMSSSAEAFKWLEANSPDVAVLDIDLRDGDCVAIAELLCDRNIPFVVHSGSKSDSDNHDPIFQKGRWVTKPSLDGELTNAVAACVSDRSIARMVNGTPLVQPDGPR